MTSREESDEEIDDPIQLIDFEQQRLATNQGQRSPHTSSTESAFEVIDSDGDLFIEKKTALNNNILPKFKKVSITLPLTFFEIPRNVELLNGCKLMSVKVVNCEKYPWYHKKFSKSKLSKEDREVDFYTQKMKYRKEDDMIEEEKKIRIRPVSSPYENLKIDSPNKNVILFGKDIKLNETLSEEKNLLPIDYKKNMGLIGMKISQTNDTVPKTQKTSREKVKTKTKSKDKDSKKAAAEKMLKSAANFKKGNVNMIGTKVVSKSSTDLNIVDDKSREKRAQAKTVPFPTETSTKSKNTTDTVVRSIFFTQGSSLSDNGNQKQNGQQIHQGLKLTVEKISKKDWAIKDTQNKSVAIQSHDKKKVLISEDKNNHEVKRRRSDAKKTENDNGLKSKLSNTDDKNKSILTMKLFEPNKEKPKNLELSSQKDGSLHTVKNIQANIEDKDDSKLKKSANSTTKVIQMEENLRNSKNIKLLSNKILKNADIHIDGVNNNHNFKQTTNLNINSDSVQTEKSSTIKNKAILKLPIPNNAKSILNFCVPKVSNDKKITHQEINEASTPNNPQITQIVLEPTNRTTTTKVYNNNPAVIKDMQVSQKPIGHTKVMNKFSCKVSLPKISSIPVSATQTLTNKIPTCHITNTKESELRGTTQALVFTQSGVRPPPANLQTANTSIMQTLSAGENMIVKPNNIIKNVPATETNKKRLQILRMIPKTKAETKNKSPGAFYDQSQAYIVTSSANSGPLNAIYDQYKKLTECNPSETQTTKSIDGVKTVPQNKPNILNSVADLPHPIQTLVSQREDMQTHKAIPSQHNQNVAGKPIPQNSQLLPHFYAAAQQVSRQSNAYQPLISNSAHPNMQINQSQQAVPQSQPSQRMQEISRPPVTTQAVDSRYPYQQAIPPTTDIASLQTKLLHKIPQNIQQGLNIQNARGFPPQQQQVQQLSLVQPIHQLPPSGNFTAQPRQEYAQHFFPTNYGLHGPGNIYGQGFQQVFAPNLSKIPPNNVIHCAPVYNGVPKNINSLDTRAYQLPNCSWSSYYPPPMVPPPPPNNKQPLSNTPNPPPTQTPKSITGTTIIGCNDGGPIRKININKNVSDTNRFQEKKTVKQSAAYEISQDNLVKVDIVQRNKVLVNQKITPDKTEISPTSKAADEKKNIPKDGDMAQSKREMLEELSKITKTDRVESPKIGSKRMLSGNEHTNSQNSNTIKRAKPGPLSRKPFFKNLTPERKTQTSPVANKGYSPPILPIPSYEKTLEILAKSNLGDSRLLLSTENELNEPSSNLQSVKQVSSRRISFVDDKHDESVKKISLNEYKQRWDGWKFCSATSHNKKEDDNSVKKNVRGEDVKIEIKSENFEQDLGYDSDSTMKI